MPASDVYSWAKASSKPSYSWSEITGKPSTFTPASHTHSYLPLSGGTMSGSITTVGGATIATDGNIWSPCWGDWLSNVLNAKIPTSASCNKNWNWSGKGGQPTWVWGGEDGTNMYVYNPGNFNVHGLYLPYGVGCTLTTAWDGTTANFGIWVNTGGTLSGVYNLGFSQSRWKAVYASSGTIQTSDRNAKDNIKPLTDQHIQFFLLLQPVSFTFKDGTSGRTHIGFIAQDVEEAMKQTGLTDLDFAGFCKDIVMNETLIDGVCKSEPVLDENGNPTYIYSLRYEEFIAILAHALQKLYERVATIEDTKQ